MYEYGCLSFREVPAGLPQLINMCIMKAFTTNQSLRVRKLVLVLMNDWLGETCAQSKKKRFSDIISLYYSLDHV